MSFTFDGEGFKPWYLGDGIYGFWAPWGRLTLSVKPGENSTTAIHLEPAVVERLEEAIAARHARCLNQAKVKPKTVTTPKNVKRSGN